jgi:hypothetical protein
MSLSFSNTHLNYFCLDKYPQSETVVHTWNFPSVSFQMPIIVRNKNSPYILLTPEL